MDYKLYKFRKVIGKIFDKLIEIIFYIPAWLYKNSEGFYKFIEATDQKSYVRSEKRRLAKKVFRCLEKYQECTVLLGTDYDNEFDFDLEGHNFDLLLSDEKWIKRNKLKIDRTTVGAYFKTHNPDRLWAVRSYDEEKVVYIISK